MSSRTLFGMALLIAAAATPAMAQQDNGGPPDFAEMRQRFLDRMKQTLGATDDEWKILQPKIEKVQQLQRDASPRPMGMMFGPPPGGPEGGPGGPPPDGAVVFRGPPPGFGPDGDRPPSAVQEKLDDLRTALRDKDAKLEDIKAKVAALREARAKAKADLAAAQDDLKGILTGRQEAVLLSMGILE